MMPVMACGVGKSWLDCALGYKACRESLLVLYQRVPRPFALLALGRGDARSRAAEIPSDDCARGRGCAPRLSDRSVGDGRPFQSEVICGAASSEFP
jgi:hypothetical protein